VSASAELNRFLSAPKVGIAELEAWYDSLPAVDGAFMLGEWRGGCFKTGHPGEAMLGKLNWRGKRFTSATDVSPMLCEDETGEVVVNPVLGAAQLREVVYRGVATATMVYDSQPIFDHFRQIDADTVLGVMDRKGDTQPLFFWLQRYSG